jgi:prepilin-type N-terminal cleavage/methylation domain-containing protein
MHIRPSPTGKKKHRAGFTLLEILVVFAIIGMLTGLAVPVYSKLAPRLRMLAATHQILIDLRHAHDQAVAGRRTISAAFNPARNSYVIGDVKRSLDVDFSVAFDSNNQPMPLKPVLRFYADGSATPARVALFDAGFKSMIRVDGLTGEPLSNAE